MDGGTMTYTQRCQIAAESLEREHQVRLQSWSGAVAKVTVNGAEAGYIWHAPWSLGVTPHLRAGENEITVTVYGTPKNPLGPHHGEPPLGFAGPNSFRISPEAGAPPGDAYHPLDYGLFEPYLLLH